MVRYCGGNVTTLSKYCQLEIWNYFLFLLVVKYEAGAYEKKKSQGIPWNIINIQLNFYN